jgi:hypothetical protein
MHNNSDERKFIYTDAEAWNHTRAAKPLFFNSYVKWREKLECLWDQRNNVGEYFEGVKFEYSVCGKYCVLLIQS